MLFIVSDFDFYQFLLISFNSLSMSELEIGSFLLTPFNSPSLNELERGRHSRFDQFNHSHILIV